MSEISSLINAPKKLPTKAIKRITARSKMVELSKDIPKRAFDSKKDRRKLSNRRKYSRQKKSLFDLRSGQERRQSEGSSGIDISI